MEENFRIGIVGGKGKMGSFFANFFKNRGYEVVIKDKDFGPPYQELCQTVKLILLSVPLDIFPRVVEELARHVGDKNWVMDISSLKSFPARLMKRYLRRGEVLATHPLFGPYEKSLEGQIITYYPIRGKELEAWFQRTFSEVGVRLVYVNPREHDHLMGLIQVLNHFSLVLLGDILAESGLELEKVVQLSTPSFVRQLETFKRLAWQDANLYTRIQLDNPYGRKFRKLFLRSCRELVYALNRGKDPEKTFKEKFGQAQRVAYELLRLLPEKEERQG